MPYFLSAITKRPVPWTWCPCEAGLCVCAHFVFPNLSCLPHAPEWNLLGLWCLALKISGSHSSWRTVMSCFPRRQTPIINTLSLSVGRVCQHRLCNRYLITSHFLEMIQLHYHRRNKLDPVEHQYVLQLSLRSFPKQPRSLQIRLEKAGQTDPLEPVPTA